MSALTFLVLLGTTVIVSSLVSFGTTVLILAAVMPDPKRGDGHDGDL